MDEALDAAVDLVVARPEEAFRLWTSHAAWRRHLAAPDVAALTTTVTEAGYLLDRDGGLDLSRPVVRESDQVVDPSLAAWIEERVTTVTTVVDRIAPRTTDEDVAAVASSGADDRCPVVTEPFTERALTGAFPAGRPAWEVASAVADPVCREQLERWWDVAAEHLPAHSTAACRDALVERFTNPGILHRLEQIGSDGSQKLPVRLLPVRWIALPGGG